MEKSSDMNSPRLRKMIGGMIFVLLFFLPLFTFAKKGTIVIAYDLTILEELGKKITAISLFPYRAIALTHSIIQEQGNELTQKSLAILRLPYDLTQQVKNNVDQLPKQVASLLSAQESTKSQITNYKQIPNPNDQIPKPVIAIRQLAEKQSQIQDTKYQILNTTKEIIREVIVKEISSPIPDTKYSIQDTNIGDKLAALRSELTDSFAKRINTLVGGFGFNTNRFDDLFVQKSLELQGKLNQPASVASSPITFSSSITSKDISATSLALSSVLTVSGTATSTISGPLKIAGGVTAGSGNVQIIDSTGKIPALSSSYFATLPSLFSSIGNASSTVQFSANQFQDTLSFEGIGGTTISFDATTKKITISTTSPTLLNVLNQGADASTFTGTTKLGGTLQVPTITTASGALTLNPVGDLQFYSSSNKVDSSGNLTLAGIFTINANATSTIENNLHVKGSLKVGTSSITLTDTGITGTSALTIASGGTNQSLTLNPSGSGNVSIGGPLAAGTGNLRLRASGTSGGSGNNASIYFENSSGTSVGRIDTSTATGGTASQSAGTGKDGAINITGSSNCQTTAIGAGRTSADCIATGISTTSSSGQKVVSVSSTAGFSPGDEVLLIQATGTGAGSYEFLHIAQMSTSTITMDQNLSNTYTNDGSSKPQAVRVPNYTEVTLGASGVLTVSAWNGTTGGVLAFRAQNRVTIASGGIIEGNGLGFGGGAAGSGGSGGPFPTAPGNGDGLLGSGGTASSGLGGGGGGSVGGDVGHIYFNQSWNTGGGGGGGTSGGGTGGSYGSAGSAGSAGTSGAGGNGGYATSGGVTGAGGSGSAGAAGTVGSTYGNANLSTIFLGSGGGGGVGGNGGGGGEKVNTDGGTGGAGGNGGAGGTGGGIIYIETVTLSNSGTIRTNGNVGSAGSSGSDGSQGTDTSTASQGCGGGGGGGAGGSAGGGGSGGSIFLKTSSLTAGTITSSGGAGSSTVGNGGVGGRGGNCTGSGSQGGGGGGGGAGATGTNGGQINSPATAGANAAPGSGGAGGSGRIRCDTAAGSGCTTTPSANQNVYGASTGNQYATFYIGTTNTFSADVAEYYPIAKQWKLQITNHKLQTNSNDQDSKSETFGISNLETPPSRHCPCGQSGNCLEFGACDLEFPEQGDVVGVVSDGGGYGIVKAALPTSPTSPTVRTIGVVSTRPGLILGGGEDSKDSERLVALAGRVPVKVNSQNSIIKVGDALTLSQTPGVGMKATTQGQIIGYALGEYLNENPGDTGLIQMFVNLSYLGNNLTLQEANSQLQIANSPLIDKSGNQLTLTHEGTVVIKRLVVKDLELAKGGSITLPKGEGQVLGKVIVPEGLTYHIVESSAVHPESEIFLSLRSTPPNGLSYATVNVKEGQFMIQLSRGAEYPLEFRYWILDTYDAGIATPVSIGQATSTIP